MAKKITAKHVFIGAGAISISVIGILIAAFFVTKESVQSFSNQSKILGTTVITPLGEGVPSHEIPELEILEPFDHSKITAKSILIYDLKTGQIFDQKNPDQPIAIASLTKLMTGLIAYKKIANFDKMVTVAKNDVISITPGLGLREGDQVKFGDLFYSMLIGSANDAAQTIANHIENTENTEFTDLMNQEAAILGMKNSHFSNPLGFDSETNYSSASDVQKLVEETTKLAAFGFSGQAKNYQFTNSLGRSYKVKATNLLPQKDKEIFAIKTGKTYEAQEAMVSEIVHNNRSIIIIILGSQDREADTLNLKNQLIKSIKW